MEHFANPGVAPSRSTSNQYIRGPSGRLQSFRPDSSQSDEALVPPGRYVPSGRYIPGPHGLRLRDVSSLPEELLVPNEQDAHAVLRRTVPYAVPTLTYKQLYTILDSAKVEVNTPHGLLKPELSRVLRSNLRDGLIECSQGEGSPQQILQIRLDTERDMVNQWNLVNRGTASEYYEQYLSPCRRAAVEAGVQFLQPPPLEPVYVHLEQTNGGIQSFSKGNEVASHLQPTQAWSAATPKKRAGNFVEPTPTAPKKLAKKSPNASATAPTTPTEYAQNELEQDLSNITPSERATISSEPSATTPTKAPRRKGALSPTFDLLRDTPSCNVPFPMISNRPANVTVVELLVFLPQWLRSTDVIERVASNGCSCALITKIVNAHRTTAAPTYHNYWFHLIARYMRARGDQTANGGHDYRKWSFSNHIPLANHNTNSIDIAGFRTNFQIEGRHHNVIRDKNTNPILFRDLAKGIKQWPSGDDALNLTRCIQYAVNHPTEEWIFPVDFERMTQQLSGSSTFGVAVTPHHTDRAAFARWKGRRT